eukprot:7724677-Ditylum_brightwellii.AAC.1
MALLVVLVAVAMASIALGKRLSTAATDCCKKKLPERWSKAWMKMRKLARMKCSQLRETIFCVFGGSGFE